MSPHDYLAINNIGQIFLVAYLKQEYFNPDVLMVNITAFNTVSTAQITQQIKLIDVNSRPPRFISTQRIFRITEVCFYSTMFG